MEEAKERRNENGERRRKHGSAGFVASKSALVMPMLLLLVLLLQRIVAQSLEGIYDYNTLEACTLTSLELSLLLGSSDPMDQGCILYDEKPSIPSDTAALITMIQVSPSSCKEQRDGALIATRMLNEDNGGKGVAVGFFEDHYVSVQSPRAGGLF
jgi:hypothetical protein